MLVRLTAMDVERGSEKNARALFLTSMDLFGWNDKLFILARQAWKWHKRSNGKAGGVEGT
jgi:hypothetical protein